MPSHTIHSALTQMYHDVDGAPWKFAEWRELTGVHHGLFPNADHQLPAPWTRQTAIDISSYFDQFRAITTAPERIKFASQSPRKDVQLVPGRKAWRDWVTKLWKDRKVHEKIIDVLLAENIHPFYLLAQDPSGGWPDANLWLSGAIDPVGTLLFGEEALFQGLERLHSKLRPTTKELIQRTWMLLNNVRHRSERRLSALESKAIQAFEDLDRGKLTKKKIQTVLIKVMKWKQLADAVEILYCPDERIEEMKEELDTLMAGLGLNVKTPRKKTKLCRVTRAMLESLATEEDVSDVLDLYRACFDSSSGDTSVFELPTYECGGFAEEANLGVEIESTLSPDDIASNLGFYRGNPLLFNTHRHIGGLTPWDNSTAFEGANQDDDFVPFGLRWHQLAGVHAVLRRLFTKELTPGNLGVLIADEVGLGKTLQSVAIMATLTEYIGRQSLATFPEPSCTHSSASNAIPPLLRENPYLGDSSTIPIAAHLIIVPGTVLSQWHNELKVALMPRSFDIFVYTTGQSFRDQFWSEEGPFAKSVQPPSSRIILATHSALTQDYNLLHMSQKAPHKEPWMEAKKKSDYDSVIENTLFHLNFLTVTIDEAHQFRNVGAKHSAALRILQKAKVRLIMTATPLQTSTKDLAGMGRLVGIPHFFTTDSIDEEKHDQAELRRSKAKLDEDHDPLDVEQNEDDPVREAQIEIARRMQDQFEQRILRRTADGKNWKGDALISLPPLHEHIAILSLQPFELKIHEQLAEKLREDLSACSTAKMFSSSFYLPSRMGAVYPRLDLSDAIPRFATLEAWQKKKSTKIDTSAKMCLHILSRDDAPIMEFRDGQVFFPEIPPPAPGESVSRLDKILIYEEFPSFGPLVRNVFDLYGIPCLYMDGDTSFENRAKLVKRFDSDPSIRVLFFSSVGSSGLNLSVANHVIFLDQPWSAQDVRQIGGRAHRPPQKKAVHCYHLLADGTSDIILSALARGKKDMLETFLQRADGQELYDLFTRGVVPDPNLDDEMLGLDEPDGPQAVNSKLNNDTQEQPSVKKGKGKKMTAEKTTDDHDISQRVITKAKEKTAVAKQATDDGTKPGQGEPSKKGKGKKAAKKTTDDGTKPAQGEPSKKEKGKKPTAKKTTDDGKTAQPTVGKATGNTVTAKKVTNDNTQSPQNKSFITKQNDKGAVAVEENVRDTDKTTCGDVVLAMSPLASSEDQYVPRMPPCVPVAPRVPTPSYVPRTPSRGPEISHRRRRSDLQSSPEAQNERKRPRLVTPEQDNRQASPESDASMSIYQPVNSPPRPLQDEFSAKRRASTDSNFSITGLQPAKPNRRTRTDSDVSMGQVKSNEQLSRLGSSANSSTEALPISSYSGDERHLRETDEMRITLKDKLHIKATGQWMSADEKARKKTLQNSKYHLLGAGTSANAPPLQQQPGTSNLSQTTGLRGLSPPPRLAPSRNPFRHGANKGAWK